MENESYNKRVLMLVYSHVRDDPRVRRAARTVAKLDYTVDVFGAARQGGFSTKETLDGFNIVLMPVFTNFGMGSILSMAWQLVRGEVGEQTVEVPQSSHKMRSLFTLIFFNLWILRFCISRRYDLIHTHDIQPVPAAILLNWFYRGKLIHDAHENVEGLYGDSLLSRYAVKLESYYMARVNYVITVGERLKQALLDRGAKNVVVVGNWRSLNKPPFDQERISNIREKYEFEKYKLIVSYLGLFFPHRSLPPMLEAVAQSPDVLLLIGGRGPLEDIVVDYAEKNTNIIMLGWVSMEDVDFYTDISDVVYCCIDSDTSHQAYYVAPNKLFESLIAGKAIIARQDVGEIGELLQDIQSGILLEDVTSESVKEAFQMLKKPEKLYELQQNALAHRESYTWEVAEKRLLDMYSALLGDMP